LFFPLGVIIFGKFKKPPTPPPPPQQKRGFTAKSTLLCTTDGYIYFKKARYQEEAN